MEGSTIIGWGDPSELLVFLQMAEARFGRSLNLPSAFRQSETLLTGRTLRSLALAATFTASATSTLSAVS